MNDIPISYPGRYAPGVALNFADANGSARQVSQSAPLPVTLAAATGGTTGSSPLSGTATAEITAGPFAPALGKPLILSLRGTWTGSVQLLRSIDNGTNRLPLSLAGSPWGVFKGNVCEPVWEESEENAKFYLKVSPATGSVIYRLAQ